MAILYRFLLLIYLAIQVSSPASVLNGVLSIVNSSGLYLQVQLVINLIYQFSNVLLNGSSFSLKCCVCDWLFLLISEQELYGFFVAEPLTNASHLIFAGLVQRTSKWATGFSFTRAGDAMPVRR